MTKYSLSRIHLFITSMACCLGGCWHDSSYADVSGTVTLDGQNIQEGSIRFIPIDGNTGSAGGAITGGSFSVRVPVNRMRVEISAANTVGSSVQDVPALVAAENYVMPKELVPEKYNVKSELVLDVVAGSNQTDYPLKSK